VRLIGNFTLFLHSVPVAVLWANSAKMPPKKKQRVDLTSSRPVRQRFSTYSRPVDTVIKYCTVYPVHKFLIKLNNIKHQSVPSTLLKHEYPVL
jgi:hypothetical protein